MNIKFKNSTELMDYAYRHIMCCKDVDDTRETGLAMRKLVKEFCNEKSLNKENEDLFVTWVTYTMLAKIFEF